MRTKTSAPSTPPRRAAAGLQVGRSQLPSEEFGIAVDGAVGYSLRLIPSNKILGRFASTHEAWLAVVYAVDSGRPARTLVLDWQGSNGSQGRVSGGLTLEYLARSGLGMPAEHLRSSDQRRG